MASLQTHTHQTTARFRAQPQGGEPGHDLAGASYWPMEPLQAFTLCMASHGLCVSSAMMLGDRHYARGQLDCAQALNDEPLRELAVSLRHYLEPQPGPVSAGG